MGKTWAFHGLTSRGIVQTAERSPRCKSPFFPLPFNPFSLKRGVLVFLNGRFVPEEKAVISVFDRGFLYGDGLFETIRIVNGKPFRWREHIERMRAGAEFLKIKLPYGANQLRRIAGELVARNKMPDSILRVNFSRGTGPVGYSPRNADKSTLVMSLRAGPRFNQKNPQLWKLIISSFRLGANDPLTRIKTSNKLPQILARAQADDAGADEALLLNTDGYVAEGTSSNVFWVKRGAIYTPPLESGILPGVTRTVVFEIARKLRVPIREKNGRVWDLAQSDGVFLSLSSWGIVEVNSLNGKTLKTTDTIGRIRLIYQKAVGLQINQNFTSLPASRKS